MTYVNAAVHLTPEPVRFRPNAPEPIARDMTLWQMLRSGAARNLLTAIPVDAFEHHYRRVSNFGMVFHGVTDPDAIQRVFLDNAMNYRRPDLVRRMLNPVIGAGLFMAEGEAWKAQRRLMAPVFAKRAVAAFAPLFGEVAARGAARIAGAGPVVDMAEMATRTTLEVIDEALCSGEAGMPFDETSALVRDFMAGTTEIRMGMVFGLEMLDGGPRQRLARRARRMLVSRMAAFIHRRADAPDPPEDFVTRLYRAFLAEHPRDEAIQMTLDNALTFFVAGHETTANAIAWALYLLSGDRRAQAWAREEAREAWTGAAGDPAAVLERLPYLRMIWDETLRLYPPVHRIERQAIADDDLCGRRVRKGEMVTIWPWVVHRHRRLWNEPDLFNPENFDPEAKEGRHRFQYIPFGAGPRMCVGMGFAQAEALMVLSRWLAEFEFTPAPGYEVQPQADFSLRPRDGLPLVVQRAPG